MVGNKCGDPFNPPEEDLQADLKSEEIMAWMNDIKCSYPQEIMVEVNISKDTMFRRLRQLEKGGKIKRMSLDGKERIPSWLEPRIQHLWSRGIKGNAIRRMSWYLVVEDEGQKS